MSTVFRAGHKSRKRKKRILATSRPRDVNDVHPAPKHSQDRPPTVVRRGVDRFGIGKYGKKKGYKARYVEYAVTRGHFYNPVHAIVKELTDRVRDALDPAKAPSKVREWKDMTNEERAAIQKRLSLQ